MSFDALPDALRSLIVLHMPTMDHVAVLVALRGDRRTLRKRRNMWHRRRDSIPLWWMPCSATGIRLLAFALIIVAIIDKNRAQQR